MLSEDVRRGSCLLLALAVVACLSAAAAVGRKVRLTEGRAGACRLLVLTVVVGRLAFVAERSLRMDWCSVAVGLRCRQRRFALPWHLWASHSVGKGLFVGAATELEVVALWCLQMPAVYLEGKRHR
jgi:hypothetical protein